MNNYTTVNLQKYNNNNGFSYKEYYDLGINGDFSFAGSESTFPSEELPESNSIFYVNEVPFIFPSKDVNSNNNIEFCEQNIHIENGKYNSLHFLGCTDYEAQKEKITLLNNLNIPFQIDLGFSSWISTEPKYNERIAIRCSKVYTTSGDVTLYQPTIWCQTLNISHIDDFISCIKLRNNPSFHIFGITLEY